MTAVEDKQLKRDLERKAKGLRRITRSSTTRGLTVLRKSVASEAPVGKTRSVRKAIGKRLAKYREGSDTIDGKVGPGVGKKKKPKNGGPSTWSPHAHLNVLGTAERFTKSGASRGRVAPNDFVTRGLRKSQSQAAQVTKDSFTEKLKTL